MKIYSQQHVKIATEAKSKHACEDLALVAHLDRVLAAYSRAHCSLQCPDMLEDQCNALAVAEPWRLTHSCIEQPLYFAVSSKAHYSKCDFQCLVMGL